MLHDLLIEAAFAHIPVGVGVAQEHQVDALADGGFLQRHHFAVLRIVGGFVGVGDFCRAQQGFQERNQVGGCCLSIPFPDRIRILVEGAEKDIAVLIVNLGHRDFPEVGITVFCEIIVVPLVVAFVDTFCFLLPVFVEELLETFLDLNRGNDFQAVLLVLVVIPFQGGHQFLGPRTPEGPHDIDRVFVLLDYFRNGEGGAVQVFQPLAFEPIMVAGHIQVGDVEAITRLLP